jgi:hypothetical protein
MFVVTVLGSEIEVHFAIHNNSQFRYLCFAFPETNFSFPPSYNSPWQGPYLSMSTFINFVIHFLPQLLVWYLIAPHTYAP